MKIFYHADDYGVSIEQSERILECFYSGVLNSVSIMPNSPYTEKAYELIRENVDDGRIRCVIHLNFIEGKCLSVGGRNAIPHLVDEHDMFSITFGKALMLNCSLKRMSVKNEFKTEIRAQIKRCADIIGTKKINIDSHQHFHMIPMVREAISEVIAEDGYEMEYYRISVDPLGPLIAEKDLVRNVPVVNYIKWLLLAMLRPSAVKIAKEMGDTTRVPLFFGMPFTCRMTKRPVSKLLPHYIEKARRSNSDLELMFHPGAEHNTDKLLDCSNSELVEFYSNRYRDEEKECLIEMRDGEE